MLKKRAHTRLKSNCLRMNITPTCCLINMYADYMSDFICSIKIKNSIMKVNIYKKK